MVHVSTIFSEAGLAEQIALGNVRQQWNESGTLRILNYTESAQYNRVWNEFTLNCRGLILDLEGNIVARPWKKFFNYGEGRLKINDDQPVEVTDKMDGSLGIMYWDDAGAGIGPYLAISTRGSFDSDQALHANRLLNSKYVEANLNLDATREYTFLFEIVYPKNRIVLNYGDLDDLVLLGAVHMERGFYVGPREAASLLGWTGPQTQTFEYRTLADAFAAPMRENAEGLVVRSGSEMVKIKQVDYVELHRIVTNLNERTIWGALGEGKTIEDLCEAIPDEWHDWVTEVAESLEAQFDVIEDAVFSEYLEIRKTLGGATVDRKQFAMLASKSKYRPYLFNLLDDKPIAGMIWHSLKPSVTKE